MVESSEALIFQLKIVPISALHSHSFCGTLFPNTYNGEELYMCDHCMTVSLSHQSETPVRAETLPVYDY